MGTLFLVPIIKYPKSQESNNFGTMKLPTLRGNQMNIRNGNV